MGQCGELGRLRVPQVKVPPLPVGVEQVGGQVLSEEWVNGKFLRGPIPLSWLGPVLCLPGQKVLAVALAIWFVAGLQRKREGLKLTSATLHDFGVKDRSAKYRALNTLEQAGLIRVGRPRS